MSDKLYHFAGWGTRALLASPFWTPTQNKFHCQRCGQPVASFQPGSLTLVFIENEDGHRTCAGFYCPTCREAEEQAELQRWYEAGQLYPQPGDDYEPQESPLR